MKYALFAILAGLALYGAHRLGLWAERRGWIYYRQRRGSSGTLSQAMLEVQALVEPAKRYVLEEQRRDEVEAGESGDGRSSR
jgi:hypothetical protein